MAPFFTPAFTAYVAPARARPQVWRLVLGVGLIVLVYAASLIAPLALYGWLAGGGQAMMLFGRMSVAVDPVPMLLVLASFLGLAAGPLLAVRLIHRRPAGSLFGRPARVLRDFVRAVLTVAVVYAVLMLPWLPGAGVRANLEPLLWLALLPLSLAGVLVQTLAEELVFRGYLMQGLAARFRWPLVWFVLPAVIFGLAHYDPRSGPLALWATIAAITLVGLVAADLTRRTGALGAAWGLHFANNTLGLLVIAAEGRMPGLALFRAPAAQGGPMQLAEIAVAVLAILASWLVLVRLTAR